MSDPRLAEGLRKGEGELGKEERERERERERDVRIDGYLENNKKWTKGASYKAPITFAEMQKKGRERDDGTVIVLACTDPRCTPEEFLGMSSERGNKATIIRTAGARAQSALPTLYVLSAVGNYGKKGVIMIIGHTDCGLQSVSDSEIKEILLKSVQDSGEGPLRAVGLLGEGKFGAIKRPDESVMEDVKMLKESPFFTGMEVLGFVQDTESGVVWEVEEWKEMEDKRTGKLENSATE